MKNIYIIVITIFLLLITACTDESPLISDVELVVVEAYLYAGEPVDDIKLMGTLPLDADTSAVPLPINDAEVRLIKDGTEYPLRSVAGDSGYYYYPDSDLIVEAGDQFRLEIEYNSRLIYAETIVPEKPKNVSLSSTQLVLPDFSDRESMMEWFESEDRELTISWENESSLFFYVTLENMDEDPEPVETGFRGGFPQFISPPINDDQYPVRAMMFTHYGHYRVRIYRVNQEYVDLYESRNQDSRDLNEPLTNIHNGLGVFSAFNYVSKSFVVR